MFWDRFYEQCLKNGTRPNPLGTKIGVSSGVITKWKNGTIPNGETLIKIADHLNCSIDYLLGRTDYPDLITSEQLSGPKVIQLTNGEKAHKVKIAARGGGITEAYLTDSDIEKINALPDVDDI